MLFLAFPNGLLISQSIGCKDTRQSSRTFTFLCRASQISHLIEKKADIFLKRVSCSKNAFIDLCGCIFHYGRCTKIQAPLAFSVLESLMIANSCPHHVQKRRTNTLYFPWNNPGMRQSPLFSSTPPFVTLFKAFLLQYWRGFFRFIGIFSLMQVIASCVSRLAQLATLPGQLTGGSNRC